MDLIALAVPFFLLAIIIEIVVNWRRRAGFYRSNDAINSISAGSVGQPRDGNNKAKYLIWDSTEDTVDVRFVAYDIAAVVEKMMAAGLPQKHAQRVRCVR